MIYLDNAATSYPKPTEVINAVNKSFVLYGANPGRSGHNLSINTAMQVYSAREALNTLFNGYGSELVSFTANCTYALNIAIKGVLKKGDHVVISSLEHNSVLRPIFKMTEEGFITSSIFNASHSTQETLENLKKAINKDTKLIVVTAVSNVFGDILPLKEIGEIARAKNILFFVDGAQGAGLIPIDMQRLNINCLGVPGHKGLLGPMGVGAFLHDGCVMGTIIEGGTGTESFSVTQPKGFPEGIDSGTLNVPAICGLKKGVEIVLNFSNLMVFIKSLVFYLKIFYNCNPIFFENKFTRVKFRLCHEVFFVYDINRKAVGKIKVYFYVIADVRYDNGCLAAILCRKRIYSVFFRCALHLVSKGVKLAKLFKRIIYAGRFKGRKIVKAGICGCVNVSCIVVHKHIGFFVLHCYHYRHIVCRGV